MASGTRKTVLAAIGGNALLTVLKFGAATVGHSPSMMNEAVHSLVDTANQVLLLLGLHFSLKPPDQEYAFGHGQKKYLWNLWSAIGIFSIGCGLGLAHTWHAWGKMNGPNASNPVQIVNVGTIDAVWISLIVLAFSFIIECIVLRLAWREFVRSSREAVRISTIKNLLQSADPTLLAVLLEDSIAVAGVALAVTGIILTRLTGNGLWDIGFSGLIALVLGITAVILGRINIRFLTDIRDPQAEAVFIDIVRKYREIEQFHDLRTMVIDDKNTVVIAEVELREEAMMKGMRQRIVSEKNNLMSQTSADNRSDIALREYFSDRAAVQATLLRTEEIIDDLESKLRQLCPQVSHVTIEVQGITADYELPNQLDKVPG